MNNNDFEITFRKGTRIEQIEKACVFLYNIFGTLQTASIGAKDGKAFQDETFSMCQIGTAFVDSINDNIADFIEPDEDKEFETDNLLNTSELIGKDDLAVSLSQILNNPEMPITLYNSLQNAIAEAYSGGNNEVLNQFESSPEFLAAVIKSCQENES